MQYLRIKLSNDMLVRNFTLVNCDLNIVRESILRTYHSGRIKTQVKSCPFKLDIIKPNFEGGKVHSLVIWTPENNSGTMLYGDQADGFSSLGSVLSKRNHLSLIQIALTLDLDNGVENYGEFRQFMYYLPNGNCRLVRVMWDGRWQFYEEGERLPFEQTEKYEERIRKKRLTNDMILDYTEALGWDLRDPLCWTSKEDACYITKGVD